jgi:hypothetical protein
MEGQLDRDEFARWWSGVGERQLGEILFWRWDPIDVAQDLPYSEGEYDEYAPSVAAVLQRGGNAEQVAQHLSEVECEAWDERQTSDTDLRQVAEFIVKWYGDSMTWWKEFGTVRR